jgi:hypothetical protein
MFNESLGCRVVGGCPGNPNSTYIDQGREESWLKLTSLVIWVLAVLSGMEMIGQLAAVRQYPSDVGRGPTSPMCKRRKTVCQQHEVTRWNNCWQETSEHWQAWQARVQLWQSCAPRITNCCTTSLAVALVAGSDRSWTDRNTWNCRGAGLYSRGFPADVSQQIKTGNLLSLKSHGGGWCQKCSKFVVTA